MKAFKYISITLAIIFAVSVTSKQVKAVAGGVVAGGVAAGAAVASIAFFLGSLITELCDSINETITAYENEAAFEAKLNEQERRRLAAEVTAELDIYMEQVKQQAMEDSYYQLHYQEMTDEERVKYFIDAQLYLSAQQGTLTPAQQVLYATLTAVENQSSNIGISDDQSITLKGNVFSELYGDALGSSVREFLPSDVTVTGIGFNRQMIFDQTIDLASNPFAFGDVYGARGVFYRTAYTGTAFFEDQLIIPAGGVHYVVAIGDVKNQTIITEVVPVPHPSAFSDDRYNYDDFIFRVRCIYNSDDTVMFSAEFIKGATVAEYALQSTYYDCWYIDSALAQTSSKYDDWYLFDFATIEQAQFFVSELAISDTYEEPDVVVDVNPSSIEKAIEKAKAALGLDDVDVVVSPGTVIDEDGEAVYSPSISVAGTDVKEFEKDDEKENEKEEDKKAPFDPEIAGLAGLAGTFPLYEQCKKLLENLFNYDDIVHPPSFKFYWDSNKDGINEVYDVLDLSFLETSLTNKNMVDKGFWSTPIKVIDVIRYVIAAVIYGLFVMRLLKRLPFFYGGGYLSHL